MARVGMSELLWLAALRELQNGLRLVWALGLVWCSEMPALMCCCLLLSGRAPHRLVEVNGVSVVGSSEEELQALLHQQPTAHIIVLRRPPPLPAESPEQLHHNSTSWSPGVCSAASR